MGEGWGGGGLYSLIIKNSAHYSISLKLFLIYNIFFILYNNALLLDLYPPV